MLPKSFSTAKSPPPFSTMSESSLTPIPSTKTTLTTPKLTTHVAPSSSKSPFSDLYFENALGEILPKYSDAPIRISEDQLVTLAKCYKVDYSNLSHEAAVKSILFKILLSKDYESRYGHLNSEKETQAYLKQEIFRKTTLVDHGFEIRTQIEKEKIKCPSIRELIDERSKLLKGQSKGSCFIEDDYEEGSELQRLKNLGMIACDINMIGKGNLCTPEKNPANKLSPASPASPYAAGSWAKEVEVEGDLLQNDKNKTVEITETTPNGSTSIITKKVDGA